MVQKILNNIKAILTIIAIFFLLFFLNQCNKTKELKKELERQKQITNQNMAALNDSVKVYKNKVGKNSFNKPIAQMSTEEIKVFFPELYNKLKNEFGEVKIIWQTKLEYRDTGSVKNAIIQLDSNKFALKYDYYSKDSSLHINSTNTFYAESKLIDKEKNKYSVSANSGISTINEIKFKMSFSTGIKKENNIYKIFVTPDNSSIIISDLKGADVSNMISPSLVSNEVKKWSVGPYISLGVSFKNGSYTVGPGIGIGLQYSVLNF